MIFVKEHITKIFTKMQNYMHQKAMSAMYFNIFCHEMRSRPFHANFHPRKYGAIRYFNQDTNQDTSSLLVLKPSFNLPRPPIHI